MKKIIIIILTLMVFLPINAKETQSVWSKEEETNADLCQAAIEKGSEVKLRLLNPWREPHTSMMDLSMC